MSPYEAGRLAGLEEARFAGGPWKEVARQAGVCMSCALGTAPPEPYGCTDCLNTGWEQGEPVEASKVRDLLRRYMRHVGECEGVHFIPTDWRSIGVTSLDFTPEEIAILQGLSDGIDAENSKP